MLIVGLLKCDQLTRWIDGWMKYMNEFLNIIHTKKEEEEEEKRSNTCQKEEEEKKRSRSK